MKLFFTLLFLSTGFAPQSFAQKTPAPAVPYSAAFKTLDEAMGYIRYALEKPQVSPATSTENRVTTVVIDSNRFHFGPLKNENVKITYRFHAVTEVTTLNPDSPADSVAITGVDIMLESEFYLLDLLMYNPVLEKNTSGLAGIELKLSQPRPSNGELGSYVVKRNGQRVARPKDRLSQATEKVLLVCYDDKDRMQIANAFYQAQHIARTRNRLAKVAGGGEE